MSSHTIVVYCLCFCRACVFARRLVAGRNGAVFVFGLRRLLCCGVAAMGAWSCATAHDHGLLRLRRQVGGAHGFYVRARALVRCFELAKGFSS